MRWCARWLRTAWTACGSTAPTTTPTPGAGWWATCERARRELDRPCRLLMDLAGPKLRTGAIDPSTQVLKWRPQAGPLAAVSSPRRGSGSRAADGDERPPEAADGCLRVSRELAGSDRPRGDGEVHRSARQVARAADRARHGRGRLGRGARHRLSGCGRALRLRAGGRQDVRGRDRRGGAGAAIPIDTRIPLAVGDALVTDRRSRARHPGAARRRAARWLPRRASRARCPRSSPTCRPASGSGSTTARSAA